MWHHFNPQMQNFIDNFCVPSSMYGLLYMRNYWKTESHNYPVDWGNVGTYQGQGVKLGQYPIFTPWYMLFYGLKMVHKKIIDFSQENQQSYPVKTFLFLESI